MIDNNILRILESTFQEPSYSVIVNSFEQENYCNKDQLKINLQQINPNLEQIVEKQKNDIETLKSLLKQHNIPIPKLNDLEINSVISKTLVVNSYLDINKDNNLYVSRFSGLIDKEENEDVPSKFVFGKITKGIVEIMDKDNPNLFNKNKLRMKDNILVIEIPKQIRNISIEFEDKTDSSVSRFDQSHIEDNKITASINRAHSYEFTITYDLKTDISAHSIERISTTIQNIFNIRFNNLYKEEPSIILTVDEKDKNFSSYTLSFTKDANNLYYNGVKITLNGFRRKRTYGEISIIVIGDKIDNTS